MGKSDDTLPLDVVRPPNDPRAALPEGLTENVVLLWGAAIVAHPAEYSPWFSWFAVADGVDRMAATLGEIMNQRERLLAADGLNRWTPGLRTPAVVWWPTLGVLRRHSKLRARIEVDGARLGVHLHPHSLTVK